MRRLDALGPAPDDLFGDEEETESPMFKVGPAIMKHKSILEQDHSPFSRQVINQLKHVLFSIH